MLGEEGIITLARRQIAASTVCGQRHRPTQPDAGQDLRAQLSQCRWPAARRYHGAHSTCRIPDLSGHALAPSETHPILPRR